MLFAGVGRCHNQPVVVHCFDGLSMMWSMKSDGEPFLADEHKNRTSETARSRRERMHMSRQGW
jgi:hypothetical protein